VPPPTRTPPPSPRRPPVPQRKLQDCQNQIMSVDRQLAMNLGELRRGQLVAAELGGLPDATVVYRGVGKAYIATAKDALLDDIKVSAAESEKNVEGLKASRQRLAKDKESAETDIKEMLKHLQSA